jgi:hypothetical protein
VAGRGISDHSNVCADTQREPLAPFVSLLHQSIFHSDLEPAQLEVLPRGDVDDRLVVIPVLGHGFRDEEELLGRQQAVGDAHPMIMGKGGEGDKMAQLA